MAHFGQEKLADLLGVYFNSLDWLRAAESQVDKGKVLFAFLFILYLVESLRCERHFQLYYDIDGLRASIQAVLLFLLWLFNSCTQVYVETRNIIRCSSFESGRIGNHFLLQ